MLKTWLALRRIFIRLNSARYANEFHLARLLLNSNIDYPNFSGNRKRNALIYRYRRSHVDFDNSWARGESSRMKVQRHGLVVIFLFVSIGLGTGCSYLLNMPASNPHSEYDGPRPWATPWKSPTPAPR
jgi:hypothetical protein